MTEARIAPLSLEEARAAAGAAGIPYYMAELNIFRVLLRHPPVAKVLHDALTTFLFEGRLDTRLRELVIMRLGWATGSDYEWTQHWRIARGLDVPERDLLAVRDWKEHEGFGPAERAVLAATDEVLANGVVGPDTWIACEDHVGGTEELLELITVIALWRAVSELVRSLEVPLEEGMDPWPPDGVAPPPQPFSSEPA